MCSGSRPPIRSRASQCPVKKKKRVFGALPALLDALAAAASRVAAGSGSAPLTEGDNRLGNHDPLRAWQSVIRFEARYQVLTWKGDVYVRNLCLAECVHIPESISFTSLNQGH